MKTDFVHDYIDYKGILKEYIKIHLEQYPNPKEYFEEFVEGEKTQGYNERDKTLEDVEKYYEVMKNIDEYEVDLEDIDISNISVILYEWKERDTEAGDGESGGTYCNFQLQECEYIERIDINEY